MLYGVVLGLLGFQFWCSNMKDTIARGYGWVYLLFDELSKMFGLVIEDKDAELNCLLV